MNSKQSRTHQKLKFQYSSKEKLGKNKDSVLNPHKTVKTGNSASATDNSDNNAIVDTSGGRVLCLHCSVQAYAYFFLKFSIMQGHNLYLLNFLSEITTFEGEGK